MKMRLIDGVVADLSEDPDAQFAPAVAEQFVDVPAGAPADLRAGYAFDGEVWTAPSIAPAPAPAPVYRTAVSKVEYYGLFEPLEEAMIRLTASKTVTAEMVEAVSGEDREKLLAVAVLKVMLSRIDNLSADQRIVLDDQQVKKGLALCVNMGLLTDNRAAAIKLGILVDA